MKSGGVGLFFKVIEMTGTFDCWWEFSRREGRVGDVGEKGEWLLE